MKLLTRFLLLLLGLSILIPGLAKADGGMFYPREYPVFENGQKAFIYHANGTENLVVAPSYQGLAKDFIWVMPTPSEPQVNKSSQTVFTSLRDLTIQDLPAVTDTMSFSALTATEEKSAVEIIDQKTIDAYDTVTLKASSEAALSNWMQSNGYVFPTELNYLLGDYVTSGWYFVLIKIRAEAQETVTADLNTGSVTPLRFTFKSEKIIYPMKITKMALDQKLDTASLDAVSADEVKSYVQNGMDVLVYVLSDHRVKNSSLTTAWANWLKPSEIEDIVAEDGSTDKWLMGDKKLFLTKMSRYISSEEIKDDFIFSQAGNNDVFPIPFYKEPTYWEGLIMGLVAALFILLLSPLVTLFIIFTLKAKSDLNWARISKVLKGFLLAITLVIGTLYAIYQIQIGYFIEDGPTVGVAVAFALVEGFLIVKFIKELRTK